MQIPSEAAILSDLVTCLPEKGSALKGMNLRQFTFRVDSFLKGLGLKEVAEVISPVRMAESLPDVSHPLNLNTILLYIVQKHGNLQMFLWRQNLTLCACRNKIILHIATRASQ